MNRVLLALAVPGAVAMLVLGFSRWRDSKLCPSCRKRNINDIYPAAFCRRCGALLIWSDGHRFPLRFADGSGVDRDVHNRIQEVFQAEDVHDNLPLGTMLTARVVAHVPEGSTVAEAHPVRLREAVDRMNALPPFAKQPATAIVPADVYRVEIECADPTLPAGGMSTHFGYIGVFVSMLVSLGPGIVWDARAEAAH